MRVGFRSLQVSDEAVSKARTAVALHGREAAANLAFEHMQTFNPLFLRSITTLHDMQIVRKELPGKDVRSKFFRTACAITYTATSNGLDTVNQVVINHEGLRLAIDRCRTIPTPEIFTAILGANFPVVKMLDDVFPEQGVVDEVSSSVYSASGFVLHLFDSQHVKDSLQPGLN